MQLQHKVGQVVPGQMVGDFQPSGYLPYLKYIP